MSKRTIEIEYTREITFKKQIEVDEETFDKYIALNDEEGIIWDNPDLNELVDELDYRNVFDESCEVSNVSVHEIKEDSK